MDRRPLGRTSLEVTPLGLGLAAVGRPGYINIDHGRDIGDDSGVDAMEGRAHDVLDAAREAGVAYLDAARSYGLAEDFLASWLASREVVPGELTVGSKWGYAYTADWRVDADVHEEKDHSVRHLRDQWHESRERLGDHLGLYQIHSATFDTGVLDDRAVLDQLADFREEGLVIGVTVSGQSQRDLIRKSMEVAYDEVFLFEVVQATWNLLERSAERALEEASHEGIGVIVKEAVANGRLTGRNTGEIDLLERLEDAAAKAGVGPDGLALGAAVAQPWADVVLSGAATVDQLRSNLAATEVTWTDELDTLMAPFAEDPTTYWSTRGRLPWN